MMVTFEDIKRANESFKLTPIKGKDYAQVNQRVKGFRMNYPQGFIRTEIVTLDAGLCVMKATVGYHEESGAEIILGTGTAFEMQNATPINKTSYIENCETSAVGRALGMAGYGIDAAMCSAEELQNALEAQKENEGKNDDTIYPDDYDLKKPATPKQVKLIDELVYEEKLITPEQLKQTLDRYGVKSELELTGEQAGKILNRLKALEDERKKAAKSA